MEQYQHLGLINSSLSISLALLLQSFRYKSKIAWLTSQRNESEPYHRVLVLNSYSLQEFYNANDYFLPSFDSRQFSSSPTQRTICQKMSFLWNFPLEEHCHQYCTIYSTLEHTYCSHRAERWNSKHTWKIFFVVCSSMPGLLLLTTHIWSSTILMSHTHWSIVWCWVGAVW